MGKSLDPKKAVECFKEVIDDRKNAYRERDFVVCALSKLLPSWLEQHSESDPDWDDEWRTIVFVQLPTGQASWHLHDSEVAWFRHLEHKDGNSWDGHSTGQKHQRILAMSATKLG